MRRFVEGADRGQTNRANRIPLFNPVTKAFRQQRCSSSTFTATSTACNRAGGWSARPAVIWR